MFSGIGNAFRQLDEMNELASLTVDRETAIKEASVKAPQKLSPATKDDGGKPMVYSLFLAYFPRAIREVAKVSEYGMKKYNAKPETQGFRKVPDAVRRYGDGLVRHLLDEITDGPVNHKDGDMLHMAQEAWNTLARLEIALEEKEQRAAEFDYTQEKARA